MSKQVDQKVLEMKFDNSNFEKNMSKSMSTLDAIKEKLKFKNSKEGFENVTDAAKKVNLQPMAAAAEAVRVKFSAMEVMATTALVNITNQAVNTGKQLVKSLTVEPVFTGFKEYETQINAVQTILANTSSKGTTIDQVNAALNELNTYADKTIYNFTEMTRNIGTFTAAGVDLKTSTEAIKGIANLAAVSGSTSEQASTAMYQLSQALSSGTVKLMDWNSVVNAGMGGEVFQNALKTTARLHGVAIDEMIDAEGSFRDTLQQGWLTSDILTTTLKKFTTSGVNEYLAKNSSLTKEAIANIRKEAVSYDAAADAIAEKSDLNKTEIAELIRMSQVAEDAATKVKTFSQLKDTVKEAIQSGWSQTWMTIIGDFEESKELFTSISDVIGKIVSKSSDARNKMLEGGMTSSWEKLKKKAVEAGASSDDLRENLELTAKAHGIAIDDMIKKEGSFSKTLKNQWVTTDILSEAIRKTTALKSADMTKMADDVSVANSEMNTLASTMDRVSGRELLLQALSNVLKSVGRGINAIGMAWRDMFPRATGEQLYGLTVSLNNMSKNLVMGSDAAENLRRTFRGLFAIINIITTITGGALKFGLKMIARLFGIVDLDILSMTASLGNAAVDLNEFILNGNIVARTLKKMGPLFSAAGSKVREWYGEFRQSPAVVAALDIISKAFERCKKAIKISSTNMMEETKQLYHTLKNLDNITFDDVIQAFKTFWESFEKNFLDTDRIVKMVRGSFSEFTETVDSKLAASGKSIAGFRDKLVEVSKDIRGRLSMGDILGVGLGAGVILLMKKFLNILDKVTSPMESFIGVLDGVKGALGAYEKKLKAEALVKIATGIIILAGALFILSKIPVNKLWSSIGALAVISVIMVGLSIAMDKTSKSLKGSAKSSLSLVAFGIALLLVANSLKVIADMPREHILSSLVVIGILIAGIVLASKGLSSEKKTVMTGAGTLIAFGIALNLMVSAFNKAGSIDTGTVGKSLVFMVGAMISIAIMMKSAAKVGKGAGLSMLLTVVALKAFISVLEQIGAMDTNGIKRNFGVIVAIVAVFSITMKSLGSSGKNAAKAGIAILAMSASLLLVVKAMKMLAEMDSADVKKGVIAVSAVMLVFAVLIKASESSGDNAIKAGIMILSITASLAAITALMVVLGHMDPGRMVQALAAITVLGVLIGALIFVSKYAASSKGATKSLATITFSIVLLVGALTALSLINPKGLKSAGTALGLIVGTFAALVVASKFAKGNIKSIVALTGVVYMLGALMILLAALNPKKSIDTAESMSTLLIAMSASLIILSQVKASVGVGLIALVGMTAIVGLLSVIILSLQKMPIGKTVVIAVALSTLLIAMSTACLILGAVGLMGPAAAIGIASLLGLIVSFGLLATGIGALNTLFPDLEKFLDKGLPILEKISTGIGKVLGGFVGGFVGSLSNALPPIAANLSEFMTLIMPFIYNVKAVDDEVLSCVGNLSKVLLMLTATELVAGIASFFNMGSKTTLKDLGTQLSEFAVGFVSFSKKVSGIKVDETEKAAKSAKILAEMVAALPTKGGWMERILGKKDTLKKFGESLADFAPSLVDFGEQVSTLKTTGIGPAATAGKALAEMAACLPNEKGALGWWVGNNGMKKFGEQLEPFGKSLKTFGSDVAELPNDKIKAAAKAGTALADMAGKLPNSGGALKWWVGDNGMEKFGTELEFFGSSLSIFSAYAVNIDTPAIKAAAKAGTALADMAGKLPNSGGALKWWVGDNGLTDFGKQLEGFGTSMARYYNFICAFTPEKMIAGLTPISKLSDIVNSLPDNKIFQSKMTLSTLGGHLELFGGSMKVFYDTFSDIKMSKMDDAIGNVKEIVKAFTNAAGINIKGAAAFETLMKSFSQKAIENFISGFSQGKASVSTAISGFFSSVTANVKTQSPMFISAFINPLSQCVMKINEKGEAFRSAGSLVAHRFRVGVSEMDVSTIFLNNLVYTVSLIKSLATEFYGAGQHVVTGFTNGLMMGKKPSNQAGVALARATLTGAQRTLEIKSPSKAMGRLANFAVVGYINDLKNGVKESYQAGIDLGKSSIDGVKSVSSKIYSFLSGNIDINPTITPVLDLSKVAASSSKLNTMMNYSKTIGVSTSINESKQAATQNQNGQVAPTSTTKEYKFYQNNYSPKALSRLEIFRQTRNQLSMFGRLVN